MLKREIIHPIFLRVSNLATDTFWNYLFEDLAYGICPFGTYINDDTIFCRFKGKQFNFNFQEKSCEEIESQLTFILKSKLDIRSRLDLLLERTNFTKGYSD